MHNYFSSNHKADLLQQLSNTWFVIVLVCCFCVLRYTADCQWNTQMSLKRRSNFLFSYHIRANVKNIIPYINNGNPWQILKIVTCLHLETEPISRGFHSLAGRQFLVTDHSDSWFLSTLCLLIEGFYSATYIMSHPFNAKNKHIWLHLKSKKVT
jgi:hypothetical protein